MSGLTGAVAISAGRRYTVAVAQGVAVLGVTVFTGTLTLNGVPAAAGTTVNVTTQSGTVIGTGTTGAVLPSGVLAAYQYSITVQATAAVQAQTVNLSVPGTLQATQATAVFNANTVLTVNILAATTTTGALPAATALATLQATNQLILVSSFNYTSAIYQAYVPNLPGNQLANISPNTVLFITLSATRTVTVSGIAFTINANTPTPVPVGANVTMQ